MRPCAAVSAARSALFSACSSDVARVSASASACDTITTAAQRGRTRLSALALALATRAV